MAFGTFVCGVQFPFVQRVGVYGKFYRWGGGCCAISRTDETQGKQGSLTDPECIDLWIIRVNDQSHREGGDCH